jgi:hypothetical protein
MAKKTFIRKPADGGFKYKWSPVEGVPKNQNPRAERRVKRYCDATPLSQGEDWITGYVYKKVLDPSSGEHRYAYVECDYVK